MTRRQTMPEQWLIIGTRLDKALWSAVRTLKRRSGVLVISDLAPKDRRRLRQLARLRGFTVVVEKTGAAARVHNLRELRQALLRRTPLILLSPLYRTRSHPDWPPLPRMRAAALARLAKRTALALGGMDARRFRQDRRLGFVGWAGISAFRI